MEKELRRNQNTLVVTGGGVIAFGIWSLIRYLMYVLLHSREMLTELGVQPGAETVIFYAVILIMLLIDLSVRILVGRAAIAEGKGGKRGRLYVIAALLLAGMAAVGAYGDFLTFSRDHTDVLDGYAATLADVTSLLILVQLVITSIRLKHMYRREEQAG